MLQSVTNREGERSGGGVGVLFEGLLFRTGGERDRDGDLEYEREYLLLHNITDTC